MDVPYVTLIRPVVARLAAEFRVPGGAAAEAMLIAIGLQESRFIHRDQVVAGKKPGQIGPATGFWQFEKGGGVRGVMRHPASRGPARLMADALGIAFDEAEVWTAFAGPAGDELACTFARLLLFTDPAALPKAALESEEPAWQGYLRNWRPGKPHRKTWGPFWAQAVGIVTAPA
jgi:hypothetical protein